MKIGIVFSCQQRMLADVVRAVRPDAQVLHFDVAHLVGPTVREAVGHALRECDHVLAIPLPPEYGPVAMAALEKMGPRLTALPSFGFAGFHPDTVYVETEKGFLGGPTHHYHSRIAIGGYLTGRTPRQTMALYNALVFGRCGYFEVFGHERRLAVALFAQFGMAIDHLFDCWIARGCFMHSMNHPAHWAFADLGLVMCRRAGLIDADMTIDPDLVGDDLLQHAAHPLLPPLARRLRLPGGTDFKRSHPSEIQHLALEEFLQHEYVALATASRAELEAVPMVSNLLAILD